MQNVTFKTPAVYGDHHVLEVRKILTVLPGVTEVYASSCFHMVEVGFDPTQITADTIRTKLDEAGYLDDLPSAGETTAVFPKRQSISYEQVRNTVSFSQVVVAQDRPTWPCPGMGILPVEDPKHG